MFLFQLYPKYIQSNIQVWTVCLVYKQCARVLTRWRGLCCPDPTAAYGRIHRSAQYRTDRARALSYEIKLQREDEPLGGAQLATEIGANWRPQDNLSLDGNLRCARVKESRSCDCLVTARNLSKRLRQIK